MNPESTFKGEYPSFFIYTALVGLGIHSVAILVLFIISVISFQSIVFLAFLVFALFLSFAWVSLYRSVKSVSFLKEHVLITYFLRRAETVEYTDLQKYFIKYEGLRNKTVSTLQFQTKSRKSKKVNFRTQNLDHLQFKTQLIHLKSKKG